MVSWFNVFPISSKENAQRSCEVYFITWPVKNVQPWCNGVTTFLACTELVNTFCKANTFEAVTFYKFKMKTRIENCSVLGTKL